MLRALAALSIFVLCGCGLTLDLGPPDLDGSAGPGDAAASVDGRVPTPDAAIPDGGRADADATTDGGSGTDAGGASTDAGPTRDSSGLLSAGERCAADGDCADGYCYDASLSNPFCFGSTCTVPCLSWSDCDDYARAHGTSATMGSCVRHSIGTATVCDFSWGGLPGAAIACE